MTVRRFVHPNLNEPAYAVGGEYAFTKEVRLPYDAGEVLYLVGYGKVDNSCCGAGGCGYALVPGFVRRWRFAREADGRAVSEVEPVIDATDRRRIEAAIRAAEFVPQVQFLG